jgi:hypothetical protein
MNIIRIESGDDSKHLSELIFFFNFNIINILGNNLLEKCQHFRL